MTSVTSFL